MWRSAASTSIDKLAELNPQLTANRAPPALSGGEWTVRVPAGSAPRAATSLLKFAEAEAKVERHVVRWGESVDEIAARRRTTRGMLASLNGLRRDESLRPGTVLTGRAVDEVPKPRPMPGAEDPFADAPAGKGVTSTTAHPETPARPVVVVPAETFSFADRRRVFYRVIPGDTLRDVAGIFGVTTDEICRWNAIDSGATLHDGMTLQIYAPPGPTRADVLALEERDARVLAVGSPEFFSHFEGQRGRTRVELVARQGDTWRAIAHKYGLNVAQLERINGRARSTPINPGDKLVVYASSTKAAKGRTRPPAPAQARSRRQGPRGRRAGRAAGGIQAFGARHARRRRRGRERRHGGEAGRLARPHAGGPPVASGRGESLTHPDRASVGHRRTPEGGASSWTPVSISPCQRRIICR